ncbi:MAG: hypothetical protein ACI915_001041 [Gammaproteobacteria bacterium]|jgi:hypothetical protein
MGSFGYVFSFSKIPNALRSTFPGRAGTAAQFAIFQTVAA